MPTTTTTPTLEQLEAFQQIDALHVRNTELHTLLSKLRDTYAVLEFTADKLPKRETEWGVAGVKGNAGDDIAAILEELSEDLGHVDIDTYSLGEAIAASGRLDELLDNARCALMNEFTKERDDA